MTMIINQSASISQEMSNYSARKFSLYMAAVVRFLRNENESGYALKTTKLIHTIQ